MVMDAYFIAHGVAAAFICGIIMFFIHFFSEDVRERRMVASGNSAVALIRGARNDIRRGDRDAARKKVKKARRRARRFYKFQTDTGGSAGEEVIGSLDPDAGDMGPDEGKLKNTEEALKKTLTEEELRKRNEAMFRTLILEAIALLGRYEGTAAKMKLEEACRYTSDKNSILSFKL